MTFAEGQQETINNTDKAELLKIHELLKKHGVSYVSKGCLPPSHYILNFDFKKMKWECDFGEDFEPDSNVRMRDKDEALDDDYNPDNRTKVITQGPIPVYAVEKFARKIFFLKDFTKTIYDLNDFKIDKQVWDASGSDAIVLGKKFSWTPAVIGGLTNDTDDTDAIYGIIPNQNDDLLKEQLTKRIQADFYNQIKNAIFELYNDSLRYKDYVDKKIEPPAQEVNADIPICKDYVYNFIFEAERRTSNKDTYATYFMANLYENGVLYSVNKEKALSLYIQAARRGNISAVQRVVRLYKEGKITIPTSSLAIDEFKIWQHFVDREDDKRNSEYILGQWYELQGKSGNIDAALKWYDVAAHSSNEAAKFKLGCWYLLGKYVKQDFEKAAEYFSYCSFEKCLYAAQLVSSSNIDLSQEKVQLLLGRLYSFIVENIARESEEFDPIEDISLSVTDPLKNSLKKGYASKAIAWLKKAAAQNNTAAMTCLYDLYMNESLAEYDPKSAIQWLEKAAYLNDNDAILKLAHYYAFHDDKTISKEKRFERAKYWFSKLPYYVQYEDEYYLYSMIFHQSMVYGVVNTIKRLALLFGHAKFKSVINIATCRDLIHTSKKTQFLLKDVEPYVAENRNDYIEVICERYSTNSLILIYNDLMAILYKFKKSQ